MILMRLLLLLSLLLLLLLLIYFSLALKFLVHDDLMIYKYSFPTDLAHMVVKIYSTVNMSS